MAQRCTYCGKARTQHKGKACIDVAGFKRVLASQAMDEHIQKVQQLAARLNDDQFITIQVDVFREILARK